MEDYPEWTCFDCANRHGGKENKDVMTVHENICDICLQFKTVTHPRDFGYPKFKKSTNLLKRINSLMCVYNKFAGEKNYQCAEEIKRISDEITNRLETKHAPAVFFNGIQGTNSRERNCKVK